MTPIQDRPPVRRPHNDPHGDTATRITITAWFTLAVGGLMGAVVDPQHADYWATIAFLGCMVVSIAAAATAAALRAVNR